MISTDSHNWALTNPGCVSHCLGLGPRARRQACIEAGRVLLLASGRSLQKHAFDRDVHGLFLIVVLGEGRQEKWRECFNVTQFLCLGRLPARIVNGSSSIFKHL